MSAIDPVEPAHPLSNVSSIEGLAVRERLVAAALLGLLSSGKCLPELAGELAVRVADDALAALERSKPPTAGKSGGG